MPSITPMWGGMVFQAPDARLAQVTLEHGAVLIGERAEFEQFFADDSDIRLLRREGRTERDGDGVGDALRPFAEIPAALEREDGPPELIHPNRHDRSAALARDHLEPFL